MARERRMTLKPNRVGRMIDRDFVLDRIDKKCLNCLQAYHLWTKEENGMGQDVLICNCGLSTI